MPKRSGLTIDEFRQEFRRLAKERKLPTSTKVAVGGGLAVRGHTEHDIDIMVYGRPNWKIVDGMLTALHTKFSPLLEGDTMPDGHRVIFDLYERPDSSKPHVKLHGR